MEKKLRKFAIDVEECCYKMEMAIDTLDAIQGAVAEADFNGKSASNALYFVFVEMKRYNDELFRYTKDLCDKIREDIRNGKID